MARHARPRALRGEARPAHRSRSPTSSSTACRPSASCARAGGQRSRLDATRPRRGRAHVYETEHRASAAVPRATQGRRRRRRAGRSCRVHSGCVVGDVLRVDAVRAARRDLREALARDRGRGRAACSLYIPPQPARPPARRSSARAAAARTVERRAARPRERGAARVRPRRAGARRPRAAQDPPPDQHTAKIAGLDGFGLEVVEQLPSPMPRRALDAWRRRRSTDVPRPA